MTIDNFLKKEKKVAKGKYHFAKSLGISYAPSF